MGISLKSGDTGKFIVGITANLFTVCYYAAPCSNMLNVIKTKDASSLYLPMAIANLLNATSWIVYGIFGLGDPLVYGPNALGWILTFFQLILIFLYGSKEESESKSDSATSLLHP